MVEFGWEWWVVGWVVGFGWWWWCGGGRVGVVKLNFMDRYGKLNIFS